jgi:hypothetical protein
MRVLLRRIAASGVVCAAVLACTCGTDRRDGPIIQALAQAKPAVTILAGPLSSLGSPSTPDVAGYDLYALRNGKTVAAGFPSKPDDLVSSNYYDLALTLYTVYYRSGDSYWLEQARHVARVWRDSPNNQNIERYLAGDYSVGPTIPPPRSMSTLGLAVLASESDDGEARRVVDAHARLVEQKWGFNWSDPREIGYSLMALVASTELGDDHRASARRMLDVALANQKADGRWEGTSDLVPSGPFVLNYMNGLLMEGMILYDRAIGDPRILPAIRKCIDWTWNTQWVARSQAFQYGNVNSGSVSTQPAPDLNGLMLPAWGYAFSATGDTRYRDQGDQIFVGLSNVIPSIPADEKHYAQIYRSSGRSLGFLTQGR